MSDKQQAISLDDVKHTAQLANLPIADDKLPHLQQQLESILEFVKTVQTVDTEGIPETTQVTGLENVWREDVLDESRTFTQDEALSNAKSTHNGFFMVKAILGDA
jgi:aspartyl-tRNA(Asn)/glutamyl-tRNA(Gln) amidotransferase subunit C